jgi:hypothetical protein
MTPAEAAAVAAIRAHAEKHRKSGRATFSVPGIEAVLRLLDEAEAALGVAQRELQMERQALAEARAERDEAIRLRVARVEKAEEALAEARVEREALCVALEAAKVDIEEWIRCFPGDHADSGFASDRVLAQISAVLEAEP